MNCFYLLSRQLYLKSFFLLTLFSFSICIGFAQEDGAKIFKQNCASCHRTDDQKLTGPGLKGIADRVPQPAEHWMFGWIKNNKKVLKSGDVYANKVFNENGKQNMTVFEGILSDDQIKAVISYIENPPVPKTEIASTASAKTNATQEQGISKFAVFSIAAIILLILAFVLGAVKRQLQESVHVKKGLAPYIPMGAVKWASNHKRFLALIGIICVVIIAKWAYIGLMSVAVDEGYHPVQPINFSHETHAGKLKINCVYCHTGAIRGKTSSIPSANVCMNCHKAINEGPKTGKAEIAKIYYAVGWDPSTGTYSKPQHPIQWVRVHNLPDFVYFNHSQHVIVGKQDCKNCHGDIAQLDAAKQNSMLTMGWCLNCHRKTAVPGMTTNPYYAELHAELEKKYKGQPITVEKMGGLECGKCHY